MPSDSLPSLMRRRAHTDPANAARLRELADNLDRAIEKVARPDSTRKDTGRMLGAWAKARKFWCQVTGEPLV